MFGNNITWWIVRKETFIQSFQILIIMEFMLCVIHKVLNIWRLYYICLWNTNKRVLFILTYNDKWSRRNWNDWKIIFMKIIWRASDLRKLMKLLMKPVNWRHESYSPVSVQIMRDVFLLGILETNSKTWQNS